MPSGVYSDIYHISRSFGQLADDAFMILTSLGLINRASQSALLIRSVISSSGRDASRGTAILPPVTIPKYDATHIYDDSPIIAMWEEL